MWIYRNCQGDIDIRVSSVNDRWEKEAKETISLIKCIPNGNAGCVVMETERLVGP